MFEVGPSWSPSSARLLVSVYVDPPQVGGLRVYDLASGSYDPITLGGALQGGWAGWGSWSKTDESRIVIAGGTGRRRSGHLDRRSR